MDSKRPRKKRWNRVLSLMVALPMALQLSLPAYAGSGSEDAREDDGTYYEYVEVTDREAFDSGGVYAIVYTADGAADRGNILYHKDPDGQSDQVAGGVAGGKLTLDDQSRFPEETQTWTIAPADGGYTVKSRSGTDMYLNLSETTGSKVPVTGTQEILAISAEEGGFTIASAAEEPFYLAHGSTGQFYVGQTPCTVRIFQKTEAEAPVIPEETLAIPGYTRVKSPELEEDRYYMIVSQDSDGNLYAFYPDMTYKAADPGNAIVPDHARGCPEGTFVAALTVDAQAGTVSAARATAEQAALEMEELWFTVERSGDQWGFMDGNGLYLSILTDMLKEGPAYLTVDADANGVFTLSNPSRQLDFNKRDDPKQFTNGGNTFATNFWGPGENRFPIFLYTKDDVYPSATVNKAALKTAIAKAEEMNAEDFTQESKDALTAALAAALAERDSESSTEESVAAAAEALNKAMQAMRPRDELLAPDRPDPDHGVTEGEPFPAGTGGSATFRIPALITLNDGSLAAAIDARWDACPDGFGIDTLFSRSTDGGKTWEYTFPNYFNDSVDRYHSQATAFLDPVMTQGKDGTIYLMTDLFPGGTYIISTSVDSGYELIDGVERLAIHYSRDGAAGTYDLYVGDFVRQDDGETAFAPLIARGDREMKAAYYVDEYYNLYTADKQPMYCKQLGADNQYVQQNVFYYNADLHVRRATYLWMVTSSDNGKTWSAPTIMNPMVRMRPATHRFYGVGPGAGLCLDDGTVLLPCYLHTPERSSFIYKNPGEDTWHRSEDASADTSSESALVQIDENRVRQFCRDQHNVIRYTDHVRDPETMTWTALEPVLVEGVPKTTMNQISAIRYSSLINGKPVILVSTAATGTSTRENGKIYAFALEDDEGRTMTLIGTYEVNRPGQVYGYSSLTELPDGSVSLLYEDTWSHATYQNIQLSEIIPSAIVDGKRLVQVPLYQTVEDPFQFDRLPTEAELAQMDAAVASARVEDGKVLYTGNRAGETSYVIDGITVIVRVTEPSDLQAVELRRGQSQELAVEHGEIQRNTDPGVVGAAVSTVDKSVTVTGGQGSTGADAAYDGAAEPLAAALHMFVADGDGFQVFGRDETSARIWLNAAGGLGYPFSTQPVVTRFEQQEDGTFFVKTQSRYLAFWRDGSNVLDAGSNASGELYKFKLYRPAAGDEISSQELPGYVQILRAEDITDGGLYLIAAEYDGQHYILRPSADTLSKYAHLMKADRQAEAVTYTLENQFHTLTLTGLAAGTADVMADGIIYRVTVTGGSGSTTYQITVEDSDNGTVTANRTRASRGVTVTLTVKADEGYELDTLTVTDGSGKKITVTDKGNGTYTFAMPASAVTVDATFTVSIDDPDTPMGELPFTDVPAGAWYEQAVGYVYENELMDGTGGALFSPDVTTTRAMIVTILWRLEGEPQVNYAMTFGDVAAESWYTEAVRWAAAERIVTGYSDTAFGPNDTVTREQIGAILYRYAAYKEQELSAQGDLSVFTDGGKTSDWAVDAMKWAVGSKLLSGKGNGVLDPTGSATRAEVAQILANLTRA